MNRLIFLHNHYGRLTRCVLEGIITGFGDVESRLVCLVLAQKFLVIAPMDLSGITGKYPG